MVSDDKIFLVVLFLEKNFLSKNLIGVHPKNTIILFLKIGLKIIGIIESFNPRVIKILSDEITSFKYKTRNLP